MKTLFLIIGVTMSFSLLAQKSRDIDICRVSNCIVSASIQYNNVGLPIDTSYFVLAKNDRYEQLYDLFILKSGKLNNIYSFFKYCSDFYKKEDKGVSITYEGSLISLSGLMGMKIMSVYGRGKDDNSYHMFNGMTLNNIISKIEKWANKNNIILE